MNNPYFAGDSSWSEQLLEEHVLLRIEWSPYENIWWPVSWECFLRNEHPVNQSLWKQKTNTISFSWLELSMYVTYYNSLNQDSIRTSSVWQSMNTHSL